MTHALVDEEALLAAAIAGNHDSLERLLLAHYPRLRNQVRGRLPGDVSGLVDAEDVLQEAFVDVFRGIGEFQPRAEGAFAAWLNAVVEHRLQDTLRRLRRKKRRGMARPIARAAGAESSLADLVALLSDHGITPSQYAARDEAIHAVNVGLASLPSEQRAAIMYRYVEQQSLESTAAAMQKSPGAVRGLLHRAKQALRDALGRSTRWFSVK